MKTFTDNRIKFNVTEKLKFVLWRVEKTLSDKRENAGYQHFLVFSCFLSTIVSETGNMILATLSISSTVSSNFDYSKFLSFTKGFILTFPKWQILDSSKFEEFADDNSKFDENCGKFSRWVENTVGKGEIARYEQFLLFPQCFQMICTADT